MVPRTQQDAKQLTPTAAEKRRMRWELKLGISLAAATAVFSFAEYWSTAGVHDLLVSKPAPAASSVSHIRIIGGSISNNKVGILTEGTGVDVQASGVKMDRNGIALQAVDGPSSGVSASGR